MSLVEDIDREMQEVEEQVDRQMAEEVRVVEMLLAIVKQTEVVGGLAVRGVCHLAAQLELPIASITSAQLRTLCGIRPFASIELSSDPRWKRVAERALVQLLARYK